MKKLIILLLFGSFASSSFSQDDTLLGDFSFDYREHFSGQKGKWRISGERLFNDSIMFYSSVYGAIHGDTCVYYLERKWYYTNSELKRHIIVNFKRPKRARIIDKSYSQDGELIEKIDMKARREPEENNPEKVNWEEKQ